MFSELLERLTVGKPHPYKAAFLLGFVFVVSWVVAAVRLHPIYSALVFAGVVALVVRRIRRHVPRAERKAREVESLAYRTESAKWNARADGAWQVERARRMAREGFTRSGSFDDFGGEA